MLAAAAPMEQHGAGGADPQAWYGMPNVEGIFGVRIAG